MSVDPKQRCVLKVKILEDKDRDGDKYTKINLLCVIRANLLNGKNAKKQKTKTEDFLTFLLEFLKMLPINNS